MERHGGARHHIKCGCAACTQGVGSVQGVPEGGEHRMHAVHGEGSVRARASALKGGMRGQRRCRGRIRGCECPCVFTSF
jgi:hypothetical protein